MELLGGLVKLTWGFAFLSLAFWGCVQMPLQRYQILLDPMVAHSKKDEVAKHLGSPVQCRLDRSEEKCEYRTAFAHHPPVPDMYRKEPTFGPDVSPNDYFDVIEVSYNAVGTVSGWRPIDVK